ncbi:MAG: hypothetical protein FWG91_01805 [Lachnospiraceae bacterium]|nr:hypothetical protein [Lachnospiraceae bacterium]
MKGFRFSLDSKTARISEAYAQRKSISLEEAMRQFIGSKTYHALNNAGTGLYLEVLEFVYDMFLEEMEETEIQEH